MYKYLLFDADNTLLDFNKSESAALELALKDFPLAFSDKVWETYHLINDGEWKRLEKGETTRDRLKIERYEKLFDYFGLDGVKYGKEIAPKYERILGEMAFVIDGVFDLLANLSGDFDLYLITNGTLSVQKSRLEKSGIMQYMKYAFISEEIGASKPDPAFFDSVISYVGDTDLSKYLVIGDSLTSDIAGAVNYGIDSVYYTSDKNAKSDANFVIGDLKELYEILS